MKVLCFFFILASSAAFFLAMAAFLASLVSDWEAGSPDFVSSD